MRSETVSDARKRGKLDVLAENPHWIGFSITGAEFCRADVFFLFSCFFFAPMLFLFANCAFVEMQTERADLPSVDVRKGGVNAKYILSMSKFIFCQSCLTLRVYYDRTALGVIPTIATSLLTFSVLEDGFS